MDRTSAIVLSRENPDYRRIAQLHWGLTDQQMEGMHVHHEPPRSLGGRNIPEHLYVCSAEMHASGWHKGEAFPKLASEGGRLSAVVRRKQFEEERKLPKEERIKLKQQRRVRREERKKRRDKKREYNLRVQKALERLNPPKVPLIIDLKDLEYLNKLQEEMIKEGLILSDPEGLLL